MAAADHKPYVGPRPFERDDKDLFFGRDREARDLCSLVVAHSIVVLYAASGAGKSSLLNAGLIPLLEARGCEVLPPARVGGRIPDAIKRNEVDNVYVFNVMSSWAGPSVDPRDLVRVNIAGFLARRPHRKDAAGEPVLRVVLLDQFEELFTFAPESWHERGAFISQLAEALERDPLLRVVLVMRREFVAQLEAYAPPQSLRTRFPLDQLGPKAAQQAVEGPLARTDRKIDPEASQRLVEELRKIIVRGAGGQDVETVDQFVEPVQLQVACAKLWDNLPPDVHTITRAHIESYGDVDKALKRFYEDALNAAETKTGVSNDELRLWVDRYLITPGGTRGMVYRGPESTGREERAIPNAAVDVLEEKHLIRAEARAGGERWYELTHDRFIGPIKDANLVWKEKYEHRQRRRKLLRVAGIGASVGVPVVVLLLWAALSYWTEHQRTAGAINELLTLNTSDSKTAQQRAPTVIGNIAAYLWQKNERKAPTVLGNIASYLWQENELDRLTELLKRAAPLITEQYRMDQRVGDILPQVGDDTPWPMELRYNPARKIDARRLRYEWRITAAGLAKTWGIPAPATLKLKEDNNVPKDYLVLIAGELNTRLEVPTRPSFVLVSEEDMPVPLQAWFHALEHRVPVDALKNDGPWWLVPHWTQPLFEAAGHPASPKEAVVARAVGEVLTTQPELALNPKNVAYLLRRLEGAGFKRTVDEALASRGGIDGLVEDLRAVIARGYPLVNLEYVLDSLAGYPWSQFSPAVVAEHMKADQTAATSRVGAQFAGAYGAAAVETAELARTEDMAPYLDTADRIGSQPPVRVYLGDDLLSYLTPRASRLIEALEDLRGELFKRFGIVVPEVTFRPYPAGKLAPNAFRVEVLTQTWAADEDAVAVNVAIPEGGVEQIFLDELRGRLLAWRTWWITADYVDKQLEQNQPLKAWLLNRYALTDIKSLLRGVLAPTDAELDAYRGKSIASALRQAAPGQSLREFDWLLGSLVFWSQAGDALDTAQLVRALQDTQAARLEPNRQPFSPDNPAMGILAGIEALEQRNFSLAEERFREAVAADRRGARATFLAAYASRDTLTTMGELNKLTQACVPNRRSITEQIRFEVEDFLDRHRDSIAVSDRARLEYCLLTHYAAQGYAGHVRASLALFDTPRYGDQLEPNQKFDLGYWTLELSGRSFDPPADRSAAEKWLASAFREWKETEEDEVSARDAFLGLLNRYNSRSFPRWYIDLLQRLGELHPSNSYIAFALGTTLVDEADVTKAFLWLERAREQINGSAVSEAQRPQLSAWIEHGVASQYMNRARFTTANERQEAAQEATSRLKTLIQSLRKDGLIRDKSWPGAAAYATLINTHLLLKEFDEAARVLGDSHDAGLTENQLLPNRFALLLAVEHTDEALQLAERALKMPDVERAAALFLAAHVQLVTDQREAEHAAREFLATKHESRDYIRLMLYWYLARKGKPDQAKAYLDDRWRGIDPASWPERLAQGDTQVWRERLIGYYLGHVSRAEILAPLSGREAFKSSELNRIGMEYEDIYCEAYFYDALLQTVTGDPATRSARFAQSIQRVLEMGSINYFEYLLALYLRPRG